MKKVDLGKMLGFMLRNHFEATLYSNGHWRADSCLTSFVDCRQNLTPLIVERTDKTLTNFNIIDENLPLTKADSPWKG